MNARVASSMTVLNILSVSIFVVRTPVVATMDTQICQKTHFSLEESAQVRIKHFKPQWSSFQEICLVLLYIKELGQSRWYGHMAMGWTTKEM